MKYRIIVLLLLSVLLGGQGAFAQNDYQQDMLEKINHLRAKGCNCSGQFMHPVPALEWSSTLLTSALRHAEDMDENDYFSHYSLEGNDIGDRLDNVGYRWSFCGENLGSGQKTFDEVMDDWIESKSHCLMLMNDEVEEVAVAFSGKYWVQHFGKRYNPQTLSSN